MMKYMALLSSALLSSALLSPLLLSLLLLSNSVCAQVEVNGQPEKKTTSAKDLFSKPSAAPVLLGHTRVKPWYRKINYFAALEQEHRDIAISRRSENKAADQESFNADYDASQFSFTGGGNLFSQTSVHLDLTLTKFTLAGAIKGAEKEAAKYQRNKALAELFVEHDLKLTVMPGLTLGFDLYYGSDRYKNSGSDKRYLDREYGGGLMASKKVNLPGAALRIDYIFSHRQVVIDTAASKENGRSSKSFHNLLVGYRYLWSYDLSTELNGRLSYYPQVNKYNYWENSFIYSLAGQISYRLFASNELSLRLEHMNFGGSDDTQVISLKFEHQFGNKTSKRRKRRYKIPHLLIK